MNLIDVLKIKYPNCNFLDDIQIGDHGDGQGLTIIQWNITDPQPTLEDINGWLSAPNYNLQYLQNIIEDQLKLIIESKPKERGYDNILTLMSYTNSSNIQWKAEANAFIAWRDSVFEYSYGLLAQVQANQITAPTLDNFLAGLPILNWP